MTFLEDIDISNVPDIKEYYKGKTVFITGGSGFMGKVLIEKLLYSCSMLDRIYLLLRNKKGVDPDVRLSALYESHCFDRLRKEKPDLFKSKVFYIAGDCKEIELGISEEDRSLIINKVNIVFHVAASVRFDDPLQDAAKINIRGTREMLNIAKEMKSLQSYVHVSTAYTNSYSEIIEEKVYPALADWRDTLLVCETLDPNTISSLSHKYIGTMPNTYAFTKQLAESVVNEEKGRLPLVILRPTIVTSSIIDPVEGWIENFNGPIGLLVGVNKGLLRIIYFNPEFVLDYIPVDMAIKQFIGAAWIRGIKKLEPTDEVHVYNCCSGQREMTMEGLQDFCKLIEEEVPLKLMWNINTSFATTSIFKHYMISILHHALPAVMVDTAFKLLGKKPRLLKIQRRIHSGKMALSYFMINKWIFHNKNILDLCSVMNENGEEFANQELILHDYYKNSVLGIKKYLLKENIEDIPNLRVTNRRIKMVFTFVSSVFYSAAAWWLYNTNIVQAYLPWTEADFFL